MGKKNWNYTNAKYPSVGTMVCIQCKQKIDSGQYKWYENFKLDAYLSMHRECSTDDSMWEKLDKEQTSNYEKLNQCLSECKAFRDRWKESALNEEIESMEETLANFKTTV